MKKLFGSLLLFALAFYGADRLYHKHTPGFRLANIASHTPHNPEWDVNNQEAEALPLFEQKFFLFGKGSQSYVFLSEDGKYVLKFLKQRKFRPTSWLATDSLQRKNKGLFTYSSIKTAFTHLKEETGVLYVHLNKTTHLNRKISVYDTHNTEFIIDLDQEVYFLQKRGELAYSCISHAMESGNHAEAQHLVSSLIDFLHDLGEKGVVDNDPVLCKNFGFIDGKPAQLDIGMLRVILPPTTAYQDKLPEILEPFGKWLSDCHPALVPTFEQKLSQLHTETI